MSGFFYVLFISTLAVRNRVERDDESWMEVYDDDLFNLPVFMGAFSSSRIHFSFILVDSSCPIVKNGHNFSSTLAHIGVAARINSIALYIFLSLCATIINLFLSFISFYDPTSGHDSGQVVRRSRDHPLTIKTSICHRSGVN